MKTPKGIPIALLATMAALAVSCHNDVPAIDLTTPTGDALHENLISANRYMALTEEQQIASYLERRGWQATILAGGTRVVVVDEGKGAPLQYDEETTIDYSTESLGGETLYASATETVRAGRMKPTAGLDAALLTLRHGAEAWVVVRSDQAYGVPGDGDRIPSRTPLAYHLKVR